MQVDFNMPSAWAPSTSTETSGRSVPGDAAPRDRRQLERFIGILIEHHAGALPVWLAPVQVSVLDITEDQADYAREVVKTLQKQGLRVAERFAQRENHL